jgi:hypothetical protein
MNFNREPNEFTINSKYLESRIPEEDYPIQISDELHENYQKLEHLYETFFESNFLALAKVSQ